MGPADRRSCESDSSDGDLIVVVRVYPRCTQRCRFCGYSRDARRPRPSFDPHILLTFGAVMADFQRQSGRSVLVCWLGGEPLQWPELPQVARTFQRTFGLRLAVTTSGITLDDSGTRRELINHYEQVTISIDGLGRFHDHVRGEPGLFEQLRYSVARLKAEDGKRRLRLRVNTILMRDNIGAFSEFCAEMADLGFHELTFNPLGGIERPDFYRDQYLLPDQVARFREALPGLRSAMARRGLDIRAAETYLHRMACTAAGERLAVDDCQPGRRLLFIDEFGRASPCSFTSGDYGVPLVAIDFPEALEALPMQWSRLRRNHRAAACGNCHATHVFAKFDGAEE